VQNVHAMRPEVRARHAHALTRIRGDEAFLLRFERFFTELHDPLHAVYGDDPRLPAAWDTLLDLIAASAAARGPELRALDHEREITPDWLHREQSVGYVAYADRFAGTLQGVRERLGYLRELGVT
jgi:amylosucrase